jgi:hypothetical protein
MNIVVMLALVQGPSLAVRVEGEGYLRLMHEGRHVFTKACTLVVTGGRLTASDGPSVLPTIGVPGSPTDLKVSLDGTVTGVYDAGSRTLGRLVLADFPADVRPVPAGAYYLCYGKPNLGNPGEGDYGVVQTEKGQTESLSAPARAKTGALPALPQPLPPSRTPVAFEMRASVEVDGDAVALGDLAEGLEPAVAALDLGQAPPVGVERRIGRQQVTDRLKRAGYKAEQVVFSGASQVAVTRLGQTVAQAQFVSAACAHARQELKAEAVGYGPQLPAMHVPKGRVELVPESSQVSGTTSKVTVGVYVDGRRFNSRVVSCRVGSDPRLALGGTVTVILRKGALTVQTTGTVKKHDPATGLVTVEAEPTKALLTGKLNSQGEVEVNP